ncbi:hypothetical protein ACJX0J_009526 [Zea mays]
MSFIAFLTDFVSIRAHIRFFLIAPWMGLQLGISQVELLQKKYIIFRVPDLMDLNIFKECNGLLEIEIEMYTVGGFRFILPDLPIFSDIGVKSMNSILKIYMSKRRDIGKIITNQPIITHSLT